MAAVNDSLRLACVGILNKKVKDFKKLGVKFDANIYQTITDNVSSTYPIERYASFLEFSPNQGDPTKPGSRITARGDMPSLYYNKQSYNTYDLVINPAVIEPVVQFTYNVKVKYVLKKQ